MLTCNARTENDRPKRSIGAHYRSENCRPYSNITTVKTQQQNATIGLLLCLRWRGRHHIGTADALFNSFTPFTHLFIHSLTHSLFLSFFLLILFLCRFLRSLLLPGNKHYRLTLPRCAEWSHFAKISIFRKSDLRFSLLSILARHLCPRETSTRVAANDVTASPYPSDTTLKHCNEPVGRPLAACTAASSGLADTR